MTLKTNAEYAISTVVQLRMSLGIFKILKFVS